MAGTRVRVLKGKAAEETLIQRHRMPDWQARQVLATARLYGTNSIPVDGGYSVLTVEHKGQGHYFIGDAYRGSRRANPQKRAGTP